MIGRVASNNQSAPIGQQRVPAAEKIVRIGLLCKTGVFPGVIHCEAIVLQIEDPRTNRPATI